MGGDNAPDEIISGALESIELLGENDELILVGPKETIEPRLPPLSSREGIISVVDAPEVIDMDEPPIETLRKKRRSSIGVMAKMAKMNQADAVISAGNTGACIAAFQMRMRNLPRVICDVGANIACKPINLYQYAVMSNIYSEHVLGIEKPRIGLMSIGQEDAKGNEIVKKTRELMRSDPEMNFIGNIEGRDIFRGVCDVVVCDGFVGNVILKLTESVVDGLFKAIQHELGQERLRLAIKFKPVINRIYKKYDYNEYGGAPLLGVNGTALICHGASKSRTIKNAILTSKEYHIRKINDKIVEYLARTSVRITDEQGS
jgi:glycerol-3-phosphate acyltransferase PlsX